MSIIPPYETPSRVLRRIEDAQNQSLPSLPSLPGFADYSSMPQDGDEDLMETPAPHRNRILPDKLPEMSLSTRSGTSMTSDPGTGQLPKQSTPPGIGLTNNTTIRNRTIGSNTATSLGSDSSAARFANSIATSHSGAGSQHPEDVFEVSTIVRRTQAPEEDDSDSDHGQSRGRSMLSASQARSADGERSVSMTEAISTPITQGAEFTKSGKWGHVQVGTLPARRHPSTDPSFACLIGVSYGSRATILFCLYTKTSSSETSTRTHSLPIHLFRLRTSQRYPQPRDYARPSSSVSSKSPTAHRA